MRPYVNPYFPKELYDNKLDNIVLILRLDSDDLIEQSRSRSCATLRTLWLKISQR